MSNIAPKKLNVVVVKDELMDFIEPVYTINGPSSLKSFNAQDIQTYSNSHINAVLNMNSTDFIADPAILHVQPVTFTITGTTTGGVRNLLEDNCFSLRSNALYKAVNTLELKIGSTGNTTSVGDSISALERFNNYTLDKFINNYGLSYLDQTQDYADLVGANKNPMGMYQLGTDIIEPRGSYPINVTQNTPTSATFSTTLRQLIPISPLVDKLRRDGSPVTGLSHLSNLGINITFYTNAGVRMLSFADIRPGGNTVTLSNISVAIGQPIFSFVQLKCRNEPIPRVLAYPLVSQDINVFEKTLPFDTPTTINVASFNLTRVPHSMVVFARPSNAALLNDGPNGAFIPDAFAALSNLTVQYDGQTLFAQSIPENLYAMAVQNGISDTFTQWSGLNILKTISTSNTGTYMNGVGSVLKFEFGRDISLYPGTVIGSYNECAISMQDTATNLCPFTTDFELYMIMLYSDVIELYDNNLAQISNIPVSYADILSANRSDHAHREHVRHPDLTGAGLFSSLGNFAKSGKLIGIIKGIKEAFNSPAGRVIRQKAKELLRSSGHPKIAAHLDAIGVGANDMEGGRKRKAGRPRASRKAASKKRVVRRRSSRKAPSRKRSMRGGAYASSQDLGDSLLD